MAETGWSLGSADVLGATPEAPDDDGAVAPEVAWKQADHVGEQVYSNAGGELSPVFARGWTHP